MSVLKDRRRILGPLDSVPVLTQHQTATQYESDRMRDASEPRKIFIQRGVVVNTNGSTFLELGGEVRLQCSVTGPRPIRGSFTQRADLAVEVHFAKFAHGDKSDEQQRIAKNIASFVHTAVAPAILLDQYPKSSISILISIISAPARGNLKSLLAAATTATSVALADSGIAVSDLVTAGSVLLRNGELYNDPEWERDEANGDVDAVVSYTCAQNNEVTSLWVDGNDVGGQVMDKIMEQTKHMATQTRQLINGLLVEDLQRLDEKN